MLVVTDIAALSPTAIYWVPALVAPAGGFPSMPGSHRGSRSLIDVTTHAPGKRNFPAFADRAGCLRWIMQYRAAVEARAPGARLFAVRLDHWMLGMDGIP